MPLGIIADAVTFGQELSHGADLGLEDYTTAALASFTSAISSRTYLQGLTEFSKAWGQGDPHSAARWLYNFGGNVAVPGVVDAINPDDTMREVQSMGDAIMSRLPGYSTELDPKFNLWGEPVLRLGAMQRTFNPFAIRGNAGDSVDDQLVQIGKGFPTPPREEFNGLVNLSDKSFDTQGIGKSPYARWMELVSKSSLKADVQRLIESDAWKQMSDGTDQWKGGERYARVAGLMERHYSQARRQMESEYPALRTRIQMLKRMKGASIRGGESAVERIQQMFSGASR
jgi:hypothetical protein